MKAAVLVFPGINRERDMARTLRLISGHEPAMVWHAETDLPSGTDLVVIPGGFSYGDYLRCGAIAARSPVMDAVRMYAAKGGLVLAVCNGFQIACEAGLLPGVLMRNAGLKFVCRDIFLKVKRSDTPFTARLQCRSGDPDPDRAWRGQLHGRYRHHSAAGRRRTVIFRYVGPNGTRDLALNVNGSTNAIAGIANERGNVLGMMPHPETTSKPHRPDQSARTVCRACRGGPPGT